MKDESPEFVHGMHIAAWVWLGYLILLACIDSYLFPNNITAILSNYYLSNGAIALLFLGCAHWSWLRKTLKDWYVPVMLLIITGLPIAAGRLMGVPFPPGPMSNIEGLTVRLLPVYFIGLVIAAWHYPWPVVIIFSLGTAALEILLVSLIPPMEPRAAHAVVFIAAVRSISFIVVGYFINQLVQRLKTQQAELEQANAQLVHFAGTIEQLSTSRERNRLARELHDTLAHTLSGLSVQLETVKAYWEVEPDTARNLLVESLDATRSGLDETRRALKALRASPLEDLGLLLALQRLADSAAERGRLTLRLSIPERLPSMPQAVEQCVYRIAQEGLENVVQHANAQNIKIGLQVTEESVSLEIEDDGMGFDPGRIPESGHFGLAGMFERARVVGGALEIDSRPGQGTYIGLSIEGF